MVTHRPSPSAGALEGSSTDAADGEPDAIAASSLAGLARGAVVGRYVVLSRIDRGGMGEVYATW